MLAARRGTLAAARAMQLARRTMASQVPAALPPRDPQLGDYPVVPREFAQARNPYGDERGPWWDRQNRRHFGEPVDAEDEALGMWAPDVPHVAPSKALLHFSIAVLCFIAYGVVVVPIVQVEPPATRRTYPYEGLVKELGGVEQNKAREESVDYDE